MAEEQDKSQQTEDASPKRLEEARQKGQVPASREPASAIAFLVLASLAVTGLGGWMADHSAQMMRDYLSGRVHLDATAAGMQVLLLRIATDLALLVLPIALPIMLLGMLVSVMVTGPVFTFEPLIPKLDKINPMKGFARLFSTRSLAELIKSILKIAVLTIACWAVVVDLWPTALAATRMESGAIALLSAEGSLRIAALAALVFLFVALLDVLYQRWEHAKSLRMSIKEVKDEYKETEGDPYVKARIRRIQMETSRKRMMADVPKADVIITNPTHIAVALAYESSKGGAPRVLAKGQGKIAEKIREIARENGIPIRENKPLARSLFKTVKIGAEIPEVLFEAVAVVLAEIYRMKRRV